MPWSCSILILLLPIPFFCSRLFQSGRVASNLSYLVLRVYNLSPQFVICVTGFNSFRLSTISLGFSMTFLGSRDEIRQRFSTQHVHSLTGRHAGLDLYVNPNQSHRLPSSDNLLVSPRDIRIARILFCLDLGERI